MIFGAGDPVGRHPEGFDNLEKFVGWESPIPARLNWQEPETLSPQQLV